MSKKYELNIEKSIIKNKNNIALEMRAENYSLFLRSQVELREDLMELDPTKLWCKFKVTDYINNGNGVETNEVEIIGYIQSLYLSTGKARISDPINFYGGYGDKSDFEILNPENLVYVLENMGSK